MNDFTFYRDMPFEELVDDPQFKSWVLDHDRRMDLFWSAFLDSHPDRLHVVDDAKAFLRSTQVFFEIAELDDGAIESNLRTLLNQVPEYPIIEKKGNDKLKWKWLFLAASFLLIVGVSFWQYRPTLTLITYETSFGEWKQVHLPDGSLVHLNAKSKLTLGSDWTDSDTRQVWLDGEAFFEVERKDEGRSKFQVITNDLVIEVLGTEFNVHDRGEHTEVFLKEGKIKLDLEGTSEYMNAGEFVSYSVEAKSILSRKTIPQENYSSWKEGSLQMNATVGEILKEIEMIYGVTVEVRDSNLLQEIRNAGVPMKELATVIPILEISLERVIIKDGNKLIIK